MAEKMFHVNGGKFTKLQMVRKGLKQCTMPSDKAEYETQCADCPYYDPEWSIRDCQQALCKDALDLLAKQEPMEPIRGEAEDMPGIAFYVCPACKIGIDYLDKFCCHCGRPMKWE